MPAPLTKTWTLLNFSLILENSDLTADSLVMSVGSAMTVVVLLILEIWSAVRLRVSLERPIRTIPAAPAWAHALAIAFEET